jgi:dedicator of cytokinesis protein 3
LPTLGGAIIIRNPESEDRGQIVDGEGSISPIALMAMQANVATSTPTLASMGPLTPVSPGKQFFPGGELPSRPAPQLSHVLVNMRAFVGSICNSAQEGVELMFSLYARHERHFLSELWLVKLNHNGVPAGPRPEDLVGRVQSLFTELTTRDVAEEIYLVCRIFKTGEAKDLLRPGTASTSTTTSKESRASLLFDRPGSSGASRLHKSTSSVIRTKGSRVSQIFARGSSPDGQSSTSPSLKTAQSAGNLPNVKTNGTTKGPSYRRPFGCSVLDLSKILQETPSQHESGMDHVMPIFTTVHEHEFHKLHEWIIESKTNKLYDRVANHTNGSTKPPRVDSINVNVRLFHGDKVDDVVQAHSTVLHAVPRTNRVGFSDAPFQSRSDVFITISNATNLASNLKSITGPGYVVVSAEVRLSDHPATVIEKCVSRGTGTDTSSNYDSYAVSNASDPLWDEKFKLCISEDIASKAVLLFKFISVKSAPSEVTAEHEPPVAIAALPLSPNGVFVHDGEHRMKIRRFDSGIALDQQLASYLIDDLAAPVVSDPILRVETFLCSTRITEDNRLHSLLHWKQDLGSLSSDESRFKMKEVLRKFTYIPEIEILKVVRL